MYIGDGAFVIISPSLSCSSCDEEHSTNAIPPAVNNITVRDAQ